MKRYPIYIDYDPTKGPVGFVEIDEDIIPEGILPDIAVVPMLIKAINEEPFQIRDFVMIQRTNVDTRAIQS